MNLEKETRCEVKIYLDDDERKLMAKVLSTILADNLLIKVFNEDDVVLLRWLHEHLEF